MKQQTEHPLNMRYIKIGFDPNQIKNVPFEKYEKDFTLRVNDQSFKMNRIVADLLSPKISRLHFIDDSIQDYSITTRKKEREIDDENEDKEEQNIMKEIIGIVEKGNIFKIEIDKEQEQESKNQKEKIKVIGDSKRKANLRKISFICEIMRELGNEEYFKFLPEFSSQITIDNVIERIETIIQIANIEERKEELDESTKQMKKLIKIGMMKEEIEFISKHFYKIIKEESQSREKIKKLEIEIIEKIVENENLRLENEETLLKFINELYEEDRKYSILYEYVDFSNILETNIISESSIKKYNNKNKNQSDCDNKDEAKEEMRKFIEIFDINDMNIRIWNQIFCKFTFMNQASNIFMNESSKDRSKNEEKQRNKRYHNQQKYNIIEIDGSKGTNELNGIMRYLTNETNGNIHDNGTINITTNSINGNDTQNYHPKYLVDFDEKKYYLSNNEANTYICFDFKDKQIEISKYQIKSILHNVNGRHLKNWKLEISNDGREWEEIDRREGCGTLNRSLVIGTFNIEKERQFGRFVRLTQTGKCWQNNDYVEFYCIEFYGRMKETRKLDQMIS